MDLHKRRTPYFWGKIGRSDKYSSALYYTNSQIATESFLYNISRYRV